jgi:YihY family inner membrane protein
MRQARLDWWAEGAHVTHSPINLSAGRWEKFRLARKTLLGAAHRYALIDGSQRAAAFAYYAFFSLFPLMLLLVTAGSLFVDRDRAAKAVIAYVQSFMPLGAQMERSVSNIISGVVKGRGRVGLGASAVLLWSALGFFSALMRAVNRAWGGEINSWWRGPLKRALLLVVMVGAWLVSTGLPVLVSIARHWVPPEWRWSVWVDRTVDFIVSLLVLFGSLTFFYKLAPRRVTRLDEVWPAALFTSLLLRTLEGLFVLYLRNFSRFNALYGALGGIMALLMWIYLSGCLIVFGACLCAGAVEAPRDSLAPFPAKA